MDGIFAVCPVCGEEYELATGSAIPQKGISKETLRPLNCTPQGDKLVISQRP
jgi:nitrite reductase/ring-hydroxylating ferredoxin subunit